MQLERIITYPSIRPSLFFLIIFHFFSVIRARSLGRDEFVSTGARDLSDTLGVPVNENNRWHFFLFLFFKSPYLCTSLPPPMLATREMDARRYVSCLFLFSTIRYYTRGHSQSYIFTLVMYISKNVARQAPPPPPPRNITFLSLFYQRGVWKRNRPAWHTHTKSVSFSLSLYSCVIYERASLSPIYDPKRERSCWSLLRDSRKCFSKMRAGIHLGSFFFSKITNGGKRERERLTEDLLLMMAGIVGNDLPDCCRNFPLHLWWIVLPDRIFSFFFSHEAFLSLSPSDSLKSLDIVHRLPSHKRWATIEETNEKYLSNSIMEKWRRRRGRRRRPARIAEWTSPFI